MYFLSLFKQAIFFPPDHNVEEFVKKDHSPSFNLLLRDPTSPVIRTATTSFLHQLSQTEKGRLGLTTYKHIKW